MALELLQKHCYKREFQVQYLRKKGNEFQEFFRSIMEHAYTNVFIAVRTHGNVGDKKCDGYHKDEGIIYQCYAPKEMKLKELLKKMQEDFDGAKQHWKEEMKEWVFVHNDEDGLPADAVKLLESFKANNDGLKIGHMGMKELEDIVDSLSEDGLISLFGPLPTTSMVVNIGNDDIRAAIQGIQNYDPGTLDMGDPVAPSAEKLNSNGLSIAVIELIRGGLVGARRVQDFFDRYPVPDYVDTIAGAFKREYIKLRDEQTKPDNIYDGLYRYAGGDEGDSKRKAAVMAVLSYLFERCDIFEDKVVTV